MSEVTAPSTGLRGVVVAHGNVAEALVDAVRSITGFTDGLVPVSNTGCDRGQLDARIMQAIGETPAVVFVDMVGGSCMVSALRQLQTRDDVKVVTGVNLAMLLDFVFHRERTAAVAAEQAVATGGEAIRAR
jgi:mannose/fructose-specific phosphotransferase system component IIA